jgi:Flp pilus assembly protein TadD/arylsulfatase A-like enzyme
LTPPSSLPLRRAPARRRSAIHRLRSRTIPPARIARIALIVAIPLIVLALSACSPSQPRILVLGFDGLDPDTVDLLLSEGKLANFAKLRLGGAYGRLRSFEPMLSPILWTTIATGKTPDVHGIGHFVVHETSATGGDRTTPVTSEHRRVRALWNLFSDAGRTVGTVGWWATWPPEEVRGFIASDHLAWHFLFAQGFEQQSGPGATYPPALEARLKPMLVRPQQIGAADLAPFVDVDTAELDRPFSLDDDLQHFRWVLATMRSYEAIGLDLWRSERPDLMLNYFEGTDSTAHLFGHLFRGRNLAGELATQQQRYGHAVEAVYEDADRILGKFMAELDRNTTLVVLSDHGFELGSLPDDPSRLRDMRRVSEKFHKEEGVLFFYGARVRPGVRFEGATLLDIAPTVLALGGLAPAADMPGKVLETPFRELNGTARVATYETGPRPGPPAGEVATAMDGKADAALVEHLQSLGYLAASGSPESDRNLAAITFQEKQYDKAARMYKVLVDRAPDDAGLRTSYAGALGALGNYEGALTELAVALRLDPLNPEGHYNQGLALERLGRGDEAVASYREALRYQPGYEPARQALVRLTGSAGDRVATDTVEAQAMALAEAAASAARRGAYPEALARLAEAAAIAPRLPVVCQYEANVAYLAGDRQRAAAALERCLTLEPDNALFRENLKRLRQQP